jgi:Ca2+-binding RTX toxin-like protein
LLDSGSDTLDGGPGNDVLYGDSVLGGDNPSDDHNTLTGDAGNDMLVGGDAVNTMHGGDGSDVLLASGDPRASVQSVLYGDAGSDSLNGLGDPKGKLFGGAGDDTLISSPQGLAIDGGDGADTVDYSKSSCTAGVDVELEAGTAACRGRQGGLDKLAHVENITGSPGDDILIGDDGPNVIDGGAGNDTLEGLAGNDILFGRDGNDGVSGGAGNDILVPGAGEDTVTGGPGADWAGTVDGFVDTIVCADSSDTFRTESIDRFVCKTKKPLP